MKLNSKLVKTKFVPGYWAISKAGKVFQMPGYDEIDYSVRCPELTRWQLWELVDGAGKYLDGSADFLRGFAIRLPVKERALNSDEVAAETLSAAYREWQLDLDYQAAHERFQQQYENWQIFLGREHARVLEEMERCNRVKIWGGWFCFNGGRVVHEPDAQIVGVCNDKGN